MKPLMYELYTQYDARASFYHKAVVVQTKAKKVLLSYETPVCVVKNGKFKLNKDVEKHLLFSQTTLRHIKEFLKQELDMFNITKKDLVKTL